MQPIIQPSSALRNNYSEITQMARVAQQPVFLTRNGHGDAVLMDLDTYGRRETELREAQRLIDAQQARLDGVEGYSLVDFAQGMRMAIEQGVGQAAQNADGQ